MRWLLITFLSLSVLTASAQSGASKRALKALEDHDLEKAEKQIIRALEKDSLDPMLYYSIALYELDHMPRNIDSANTMERGARELWTGLPADELDKYAKAGLTSSHLDLLRTRIDSLAFARADTDGSESAYVIFLEYFPGALQTEIAVRRRDSVAFINASNVNTYQAYQEFMRKYPQSEQFAEAESRYDRLLFEVSTNPGTLKALEDFLRQYPATPYRAKVENDIFALRTVVPAEEAYSQIIKDYPSTRISRTARNYLYYRLKSGQTGDLNNAHVWGDSLVRMTRINSAGWVATFDKDNAVFVDREGHDKFTIEREELSEKYECETLENDLIIGKNALFSRTGEHIYSGEIDEVEFMSPGLVRIIRRNREGIYTVWGREVLPVDFLEIRQVGSVVLAAKKGGRFAVYSLAGLQLTGFEFDEVGAAGTVLLLYNGGRVAPVSLQSLQQAVASKKAYELEYVDEIEILPGGEFWISQGDKEWIADEALRVKIPGESQRIDILDNGYICNGKEKLIIYSPDKLQKFTTEEKLLSFNERYLRLSGAEGEGLFDLTSFRFIALPDSIELIGDKAAVTYQKSGIRTYSDSSEPAELPGNYLGHALLHAGSAEHVIYRTSRGEYLVSGGQAVKLPANRSLSLVNDSLMIIEQNTGKGLWNINDQTFIIQPRNNAIANFDGRDLSVFRNGKFGLYRVSENIMIPVSYDKLVTAFGDSLFAVVRNNRRGVVNAANEEVIPAEFSELRYWSDSLALVKEGDGWYFYNIGGKARSNIPMSSLSFQGVDDAYLVVMVDQKFGVFRRNSGEIIPATFDDILNIGTDAHPVFFTETHVKAADLHVVIYFDEFGNLLRRQAMDPALFYDVYCED